MVLLPPHNLGGIRGTFYSVNFNWLRPLIVTWLEPLELLGDKYFTMKAVKPALLTTVALVVELRRGAG